jgi:hypothetical protein
MTDDPMQPSAEQQAHLDQLRAAARELSNTLGEFVQQLMLDGWTDQQARAIVVASIAHSRPPS